MYDVYQTSCRSMKQTIDHNDLTDDDDEEEKTLIHAEQIDR